MGRLNKKQRLVRSLTDIVNAVPSDISKMATKYEEKLYEELNEIAESAVEDFYNDYDPSSYERFGDIYNMYKITVKANGYGLDIEVDFDPKYMKYHKGKKEYIYETVFKEGWHGGDKAGAGHPEPGIPWYRNLGAINRVGDDYESYEPSGFWLRRAARSASPYEIMKEKMEVCISKYLEQHANDIIEYFKKKAEEINIIWIKYKEAK